MSPQQHVRKMRPPGRSSASRSGDGERDLAAELMKVLAAAKRAARDASRPENQVREGGA